jgi:uncharacterized protein with FMN-binding domain
VKKILKIVVVVFLAAGLIVAGFSQLNRGMADIRKITILPVDLQTVTDGIHVGSYCKGRWCYEVSVSLRGHSINSIIITNKKMAMFRKLNNELIAGVIQKQTPAIDAIAGATISSKALLKAIENALRQ